MPASRQQPDLQIAKINHSVSCFRASRPKKLRGLGRAVGNSKPTNERRRGVLSSSRLPRFIVNDVPRVKPAVVRIQPCANVELQHSTPVTVRQKAYVLWNDGGNRNNWIVVDSAARK